VTRAWVAILDEPAADADAQAPLREPGGAPAGWLAAWLRGAKPVREARRADPRLIDPDGAPARLSIVWPDRARGLLAFDDLAVQRARRAVLASASPPDAVSTLLVDDSHFAGSITVRRDAVVDDDPFARVETARILDVGAGVVGAFPLPIGPVIERHGSAQPWPWEQF
jgi:hypothetical protein